MKEIVGKVVSNSLPKTVTVAIDYTTVHRMYKKILRRTTKVLANCEIADIQLGDKVMIKQSRPISKNKHFVVVSLVNKNSKEETTAKPVEIDTSESQKKKVRSISKNKK